MAEEVLAQQIAALVSTGNNPTIISKQMGIPRTRVVNIMNSDECKRYIRDIGETAVYQAKLQIKKEVARLAPMIVETIKRHLEDNNLQAIPHALKVLGFSEQEASAKDNEVRVVLDFGQAKDKPIEVNGIEVLDDAVQGTKSRD